MVHATTRAGRRATVCGFLAVLIFLLAGSVYMAMTHAPARPGARIAPRPLPLDADALVDDFRFSHEFPGGSLNIVGKRLVHRGRKFFAFRSTVMKTNFLEDISGAYEDRRNALEFAADRAEWELTPEKPLELKGVRRLCINGEEIAHARDVVIYFSDRVVHVYGETTRTFILKQ